MSHPLVVGGIRKSKNKSPNVEFLVQLIKKKRIAFFFPSIFLVKIFLGLRREFFWTSFVFLECSPKTFLKKKKFEKKFNEFRICQARCSRWQRTIWKFSAFPEMKRFCIHQVLLILFYFISSYILGVVMNYCK